jgi:dTDP-4-dehydrorhamnose 3,5-epimerase
MSFQFQKLEIPEVILIRTQRWKDARGFFEESYKRSEFSNHGIAQTFVQDNFAFSIRGVLRGLHYQKNPKSQGKLIIPLKGQIFDVAVDIRQGSPTYGKWVGQMLSTDNLCMLYIPPGFAHGYCVLSEETYILYKVTKEYAPEFDRGIIWNDPDIGIQWPGIAPILSEKDTQFPPLKEADNNFEI